MNVAPEALLASAQTWLDQDPDSDTRAELRRMMDAAQAGDDGAVAALAERFDGRLTFGTAGLRAELGAGPRRMNRVVVTQAAAGIAHYLRASGRLERVVIGYDGRVNSDVFARDSAEIFAGAGIDVTLLPEPLPTPVLAFAVRHLGAGAGVMVTASHNPPRDNGYKVYLGESDDGSQIVPPVDGAIAAAIDEVARTDIRRLPRSADYRVADDAVLAAYVTATAATVPTPSLTIDAQPRVVYTAMHGVGWGTLRRVFAAAGFAEPTTVSAQIEPDGSFPTVPFPNPEEPGAMDLVLGAAAMHRADIAIANDPDADRLSVAVPGRDGRWRVLSGNEVGWLLGWRAAERAASEGLGSVLADADVAPTLAASIVSAPALRTVAAHYGLRYRDTLTGFKWVSRVPGLVYGYEEALGYLVDPTVVRDKDGISAALAVVALATDLRASGSTMLDRLDAFAETFGAFASEQVAVRVDDIQRIQEAMRSLRASPPSSVADRAVEQVTDYLHGTADLPASDIVRWDLSGEARIIVRPSGTEPKLKVYIDARASDLTTARSVVESLAAGVRTLLPLDPR
ncbi:phospho-sugar mutase [Curtobacterium ammoniigenes]|uniref:phospho-sugar mutase n=1 Tax=Curtobacterium ammoniigenes TaxID=395387 RepID=UPI00082F754B|nr:phospho-sugar mutase [Curtobacterium ammoniigenes]